MSGQTFAKPIWSENERMKRREEAPGEKKACEEADEEGGEAGDGDRHR